MPRSTKITAFSSPLDDIGNGHSNLDRIIHVRPDIIKIDRCLVSGIGQDYFKQELFKALVTLAHKLGARWLSPKGWKPRQKRQSAWKFGADMLQGYYFARPQPLPEALGGSIGNQVNLVVADYMETKLGKN